MVLTLRWLTKQNHHDLDYNSVGFDFMGSGGQGGALISPRKSWQIILKPSLWLICVSFGLSLVFQRG